MLPWASTTRVFAPLNFSPRYFSDENNFIATHHHLLCRWLIGINRDDTGVADDEVGGNRLPCPVPASHANDKSKNTQRNPVKILMGKIRLPLKPSDASEI